MVDVAAVVGRVRGMVVRPGETLSEHTRPVPPWRVVAREHTLPLLVGSAAVSTVLIWLFMPMMMAVSGVEAGGPGLGIAALRLIVNVAVNFGLIALMAGVVRGFAGMFGGRADFDASYTLVALALTPLFVGEALVPVPALGWIAFLAGFVYALVILYRGTPTVLGLPRENQGKHFALTLVTMFLLSLVVAFVLVGLAAVFLGPPAGMPPVSADP